MKCKLLKINTSKHVTTILLDHPSKKNALDNSLIRELVWALDFLNQEKNCRVLILGSSGDVFCSGGDVKAMINRDEMFSGESVDLRYQYHFGIEEIARAIERFRKPIIGVLDGACVGAGADLACMCDIRLGSDKMTFSETFSNLALVPGDGGTYFLSRVLGYSKAMELYLTARKVDATEALEIGLINYLIKSEEIWEYVSSFADNMSQKPPVAIEMTKQALKEVFQNRNLESNLNLLSAYQAITQKSNDHLKSLSMIRGKGDVHFDGN